ncbi:MAG TPA: hypothetical protein VJ927_09640 [Actinomycetota bacterium]|nr:hypothetical protein [Actinomycetota bacterium]
MLASLSLVHAVLALILLAGRGLEGAGRARLIRAVAIAGGAAAALLLLFRGADSVWGAQRLDPQSGALAAVAVFCAWAIVAAVAGEEGRWDIGALVGAASTALILFATSRWAAPALLFWAVIGAAAVVAGRAAGARAYTWLAVVLADLCVLGALAAHSLAEESWRMPTEVPPPLLIPLVAGVVLRVGVAPKTGIWGLMGGVEAAFLPLLIGSGFALVPAASGGDEVAVALGLLVVALAAVAWSVLVTRMQLAVVASWIVCLLLAVVWIEPSTAARAAATAALAVGALALWPWTSGRARSERALLLGLVPATIGFGVVLAGAAASFERATSAASVATAAPWFAFAALLPAALAAAVTLGASWARRVEAETYRPPAVLTLWALAALGVVLGLSPRPELGFGGGGTRSTLLYLAAAVAGVLAARLIPGQAPALSAAEEPASGALALHGPWATWLARLALVLGLLALVIVLWFTYTGLRLGFL